MKYLHDAYVGLGSNMNDPEKQIMEAIKTLQTLPKSEFIQASSLYKTPPWGYAEQADFINAVVHIRTNLAPMELLEELQKIEQAFGRVRTFANAPRPLDLDVLIFDETCLASPSLTIPHPRMHERGFVLLPLAEIAPTLMIGKRGTADELARSCDNRGIQRIN
jgi:2-amino-4-hydroxy-6-hydroxymethyldihydropteridine diphosphokinase